MSSNPYRDLEEAPVAFPFFFGFEQRVKILKKGAWSWRRLLAGGYVQWNDTTYYVFSTRWLSFWWRVKGEP